MAEPKITTPLMYDVTVEGMTPKNVAGIGEVSEITKARQEALDAQKQLIQALEARYAQPNLFKVAAGFLKPQLGGFAASLGSAGEALGENVENQRAIAPTIAKMRADLANQQLGYQQAVTAQGKLTEGMKKPQTAAGVTDITRFSKDIGDIAQRQYVNESAKFEDLLKAYRSGADKTKLASEFGDAFVDKYWPSLVSQVPGVTPPMVPNPNELPALEKNAPSADGGADKTATKQPEQPARIPGVPTVLTAGMTKGQELASTNEQVRQRQERVKELNTQLGEQATLSAPLLESATTLYRAAAKPTIKNAFAAFEKGNPMGILGTAAEDQQRSAVLANARKQLLNTKFGSEEEKTHALSDFQAFENALGDFNSRIATSFPNQTNARTFIEAMSVPNKTNTRDSFLRGVAHIGSNALGKYENKNALDEFLKSPNADIYNWESSANYRKTMENAQKRASELVNNPASEELPLFMQRGLSGSFTSKAEKQDLKEAVKKRIAELAAKKQNP